MKRITVDLTKASTETLDLTDKLNPRVGDGQLSVPLHIIYGADDSGNDDPVDMRDKDIEFLSQDTNKNDIYVSGTVTTNSKGDDPYNGNVTFVFPEGTFKVAGTYDVDKTMFRIINKADKIVLSTVNVKLNVLEGGNSDYNFDPNKTSYNSRLEDMLKLAQSQMKDKIANADKEAQAALTDAKQKSADIIKDASDQAQSLLDGIKQTSDEAKGNVAGDTAATAKQAKQQANDNAGKVHDLQGEVGDARGRFMTLSDRENKQDFNIDRKEDKANANYNYAAINLRYDKLDALLATKANIHFIIDYLSKMDNKPVGIKDEATLKYKYPNGADGIFVTADGHGWIYDDGWKDFGAYQAAGLSPEDRAIVDNAVTGNVVNADPNSEPYDDLNTIPRNRIIVYTSDISGLKNAPQNMGYSNGAVVLTVAQNAKNDNGNLQIVTDSKGNRYWRIAWGHPATWSEWNSNIIGNGKTMYGDTAEPPYDDLNTLPPRSRLIYSKNFGLLKNAPQMGDAASTGAIVTTDSIGDNDFGTVQTAYANDNSTIYKRQIWGSKGSWSDWLPIHANTILPSKFIWPGTNSNPPYDDANTFPMNQIITISGSADSIKQIKNLPPSMNTSGLVVHSMAGTYKGNNGGAQVAIDVDNHMYHRICWGSDNNWSNWVSDASDNKFIWPGTNDQAPYNDLNTFPMNQTVTIAANPTTIKQIKNLPPTTAGGLVVHSFSGSSTGNNGGVQVAVDSTNVMYHRISYGAENNWWPWVSDRVDDKANDNIQPSLALFQKVAVVGDSYASGELVFDGKYIDHYPISWLQIMARKNGFTGTNFSSGGETTRGWVDYWLAKMQQADPQDLYILALGINDQGMENYLGTPDDMESGADTFYGNYGKIIKAIQAKAPHAKVVISTIASDTSVANAYNEAIQKIASHFAIPFIVQNSDPFFKSSFYRDHMQGGHPTGPVYAAMARAFERLIGQSMIDHLDYWMDYYKNEPKN